MRIAISTMIVFALALAGADEVRPAPRDSAPILGKLAEKYQLPGVVGAILHGDQLVALGSTGIRKAGDREPFLATDLIHLGSDTKAMTAILIGQLIDKKQLTFETTMGEIFPELAGKMNSAMAQNTVRNLLNHNAGLPHDLDWWALERMHLPLRAQRRLAVEKALAAAPATPIGKYFYSNVSYVLLGAIVELKTGKSWEQVMEQEIFRPLRMPSAGFGPPGTPEKVDEPWGHQLENGKLKSSRADNAPVMAPAGEVHCSIEDWSHFIAEILRGAQGNPTLVSAETFNVLITPMPQQDYAGGWIVTQRKWADGLALTHAGSNNWWYCTVWLAPKKDFAVLIATNIGGEPIARATDEGVGELIKLNAQLSAGR